MAGKRGGEIANYKPVPTDRRARFDDDLKRALVHGYYASASFVDAQIGKVVNELARLGLVEETIIVLWGDHGFHLGDLGIWTKHTNYEQANRIPILIAAPGVATPGSSTKQPIESVDIFPTLAELAGLPAPQGPQPIDGVSLVPVLRDPSARVRDHAYHAYPKQKLGRAIRTERYRLVEWRAFDDSSTEVEIELYDYETDPLETRNLAAAHPEVVGALLKTLAAYPQPVSRNRARTAAQPSPKIANRELTIVGQVKRRRSSAGVIVAQGGREHGYAVHLLDGRLAFDVRVNGKVTRIVGEQNCPSEFAFEATLNAEQLNLSINGTAVGSAASPGLIPVQPKDDLSVGLDDRTAAGDYVAPNVFGGKVLDVNVTGEMPADSER